MVAKDNFTADQEEKRKYQDTPRRDRWNRCGAITKNGVVNAGTLVLTVRHAIVVGINRVIHAAPTNAGLDLVGIIRTSVAFIAKTVTVGVGRVASRVEPEEDPT